MSGEHSILSPSSAHRRVRCIGALAACKGAPNPSSEYSAEGTAYHEVASKVLDADGFGSCLDWVGQVIEADGFKFTIDAENAEHAQTYVDAVRRIPGHLLVEVRIDTSNVVGVPGQGGTGDAIVLDYERKTIHVNDLKFGRGEVVYAPDNEQMIEYGGGALDMFQDLCDWEYVKVAIHQPRVGHYDEATYPVEDLRARLAVIRRAEMAAFALHENGTPEEIASFLTPGEKQCRWCPIKGSCAARSKGIIDLFPITPATVNLNMTDDELGHAMSRVDDIAQWCSDVRGEALRRALSGIKVPGWKMVVGKKGARKFTDKQKAEAVMVPALADAAYAPREIVTPTAAEKLLKKTNPGVWDQLQEIITQSDGSPSLVPESDPREILAISQVEFALAEAQTATV